MKRLLAIVIAVLLVSCQSPTGKNNKAEDKVEAVKTAIQDNKDETVDKARGYVYAADKALSLDPAPSRFSEVGKMMTERSLMTLGNPDMETMLAYQRIIDGLVSTNAALQKKAEAALTARDKEVISLQDDIRELESKLGKAEDKRKEIAAENATMASKWSRLMFWIRMAIYVVIGGFVLRLAAAVVPPPYNSIGYVIDFVFGGIARCFFKLLPKAKEAAGVVAREAYEVSEQTLKGVVGAVQQIRQDPAVRVKFDPILQDHTDKEITRPKIIEVKTKLGHI